MFIIFDVKDVDNITLRARRRCSRLSRSDLRARSAKGCSVNRGHKSKSFAQWCDLYLHEKEWEHGSTRKSTQNGGRTVGSNSYACVQRGGNSGLPYSPMCKTHLSPCNSASKEWGRLVRQFELTRFQQDLGASGGKG